jgi:hypothetical protein
MCMCLRFRGCAFQTAVVTDTDKRLIALGLDTQAALLTGQLFRPQSGSHRFQCYAMLCCAAELGAVCSGRARWCSLGGRDYALPGRVVR